MCIEMRAKTFSFWNKDVDYYNASVLRELETNNRQVWSALINKFKPEVDNPLTLDIGTGPGFIPILLSKEGYTHVTGIDWSANMIGQARKNAMKSGCDATFITMDVQHMDFDDESFDMIISRRVIWALDDPFSAYKECFRILKWGGRMIVFDGNFYAYLFDREVEMRKNTDLLKALRKKIIKHDRSNYKESETVAKNLYLSKIKRPDWDMKILTKIGFSQVMIEPDLLKYFEDEAARLFWGYANQFIIIAEKS